MNKLYYLLAILLVLVGCSSETSESQYEKYVQNHLSDFFSKVDTVKADMEVAINTHNNSKLRQAGKDLENLGHSKRIIFETKTAPTRYKDENASLVKVFKGIESSGNNLSQFASTENQRYMDDAFEDLAVAYLEIASLPDELKIK